ncbi:MAG: tRNA-dihydrouridine synthase family protein [Verrucomicrobiaceae bacterium]|nr:tRNA-dihydrouridine synthase family protein [Verrucomicrobiaceae bacterium]
MGAPFKKGDFVTFLAPMQDITDAGFMRIVSEFGSPDFFMAEYFRIHEYFYIDPYVLEAVLSRPAGRQVSAQFIGEDEYYICKGIEELSKYQQIQMLDLNVGCSAPKIYKKNVGGGLLRDVKKIASILKAMRGNWDRCLSVKMRLGFENDTQFDDILQVVLDAGVDFITVHGRTVRQLYRGEASYEKIAKASSKTNIPIIVNGDVDTAQKAFYISKNTECSGIMSGRHAVRNPWIFRQIKERLSGKTIFEPTLADVRIYVDKLWQNICHYAPRIKFADSRLKKFLNFVGVGVDSDGKFLYEMRRAKGIDELMKVCDTHLTGQNANVKFNCLGYENLCSRPNHEK